MDRLSVVHIASGDRWAGAEVQVWTLLRHLARADGVDVAAILMNEGEMAERLRADGLPVTVFDESRLDALSIHRDVHAVLRSERPDLVHTHRLKENVLGGLAAWRLRIPSLRTVHGAPEFSAQGLGKKAILMLDRWLANRVQRRLVAVTGELRDKLTDVYPADRLAVIENGVDIEAVRHAAETGVDLGAGDVHVGIVGRLDPVKRIDLFLGMAQRLVENNDRSFRFHVFGEGALDEQLKAQAAELGVAGRVIFHGHRTDIAACIEALDALVMCSDHEGMPMTLLESLAIGTPVLAHAVGGLAEVLEGGCGGVLVSDHSAEGYVEGLLLLLATPREQLMEPALDRLRSRYSAEVNAQRTLALYREILGR